MRAEDFSKYLEEIEPRIEWLKSHKKHLEMVFLMSAILERELQYIIRETEAIIAQETKKQRKDVEELTLGQLKGRFSDYYNNDVILSNIIQFNNIRKKCIHRIFHQNISKLELEIENNFQNFWKLLVDLVDIKKNLLKKEHSRLVKKLKNYKNEKNPR